MRGRYLESTSRRGRMLAAYLYLPRKAGEKSARTVPMQHGLLVDYNAEGMPIGVEITAPERITVAQIDELLRALGFDATSPTSSYRSARPRPRDRTFNAPPKPA